MKKLSFTDPYARVDGNVIVYYDGKFRMRCFHIDQNNNCFEDEDAMAVLDTLQRNQVIAQDTLEQRVKRLHYFFKAADFIDDTAIDILNYADEDIGFALKDVIEF